MEAERFAETATVWRTGWETGVNLRTLTLIDKLCKIKMHSGTCRVRTDMGLLEDIAATG